MSISSDNTYGMVSDAISDTFVECTEEKCKECGNMMPVVNCQKGEIEKSVCVLTKFQAKACMLGRLDKFKSKEECHWICAEDLKYKLSLECLVDVDDPYSVVCMIIDEMAGIADG